MASFQLSVISDEISPDFGHACEIAASKFGMQWIELRTLWDKNVVALDSNEIGEAVRLEERVAGNRHCRPAFQSGLAGRASLRCQ